MSEAYALEPREDEAEAPAFDVFTAPQSPNLAFDLDDSTLGKIGSKVCEEYDIDIASREAAGYEERLKRAVTLASLVTEAKNTPWENASNVKFPLIIQAAVQFNARSYAALVDGPGLVKGKVLGRPDEAKRDRAERIGAHMSYQLLEEMEEWEEDTDALLLRLPIVGTLVRKTYFDPMLGRNCSHVIGPDEFVVNYHAKRDLSVVPRATQVLQFYPHEIIEKRRSGLWLDVELGQATDAANDEQAPHTFLEQHRLWDLDDDGYPEPYVVTVHKETHKVVRIVARWYEEGLKTNDAGEIIKIEPYECFTKYGFIPSPDGSFYDIGFGTLLGPLSDTINTSINQLMDAATLSNLQGGFIGDGVSVKSGSVRFKPGEWKKATSAGGPLRENIVPLPTKEPSAVLFNLMTFLLEAAKDLTATQDILTGDSAKASTPVGTTLALIEQGLKTFTAIVKRLHRSLKRELGVMYKLNAYFLEPEKYFQFQDEEQAVAQQDYALGDVDVVPVSDPNMATDMQKMGRAQFLMSLKGQGLNDMEINRRVLEAASIPDPDALMPQGPPEPPPEFVLKMRELDLKEREIQAKEATAAVDGAKTEAETEQLKLETLMSGPDVMAFVESLVQQAVQKTLALVENGGSQEARPQGVPGMEGPPADGDVPPIPGGLPGGDGAPVVDGPADVPAGPVPSGDGGGFGGPGVA